MIVFLLLVIIAILLLGASRFIGIVGAILGFIALVLAAYTFEVVFTRGTILAERPCLEILQDMSRAVREVIRLFEDAFGCVRLSDSLTQHLPSVTLDI